MPGPSEEAVEAAEHDRPGWKRRARDVAVRWFAGRARHAAERDLDELDGAPRFRLRLPLGRSSRPYGGGEQTFRAFVQINLLPRAR